MSQRLYSRAQVWKNNSRDLWIACAFGAACSWAVFSLLDAVSADGPTRTAISPAGLNVARWVAAMAAAIAGGAVAEFVITSWQRTTSAVITLALIVQMYGPFAGFRARTLREYVLTALFLYISAVFGHCFTRCVVQE